jgi:hypothetical protein
LEKSIEKSIGCISGDEYSSDNKETFDKNDLHDLKKYDQNRLEKTKVEIVLSQLL